MARFERFSPGQFSWVDLMAKDAAGARAFYGALFGWTGDAASDDHGGVYTIFQRDGLDVAGMGEMSEALRTTGMPAFWSSYVTVEDIEAETKRASELGAEVRMPPMELRADGEVVGHMAILGDPEGAAISLWQPGRHVGAGVTNEPGSFAWNELCSRDVDAAKRFYGALFGWTFHGDENDEVPGYQEIRQDGRAGGGILPWRPEMGDLPPSWTVYFSVDDCDAAVARVEQLGGQVFVAATDIEPGRFAVVADPDGAVFNVMKIHAPD